MRATGWFSSLARPRARFDFARARSQRALRPYAWALAALGYSLIGLASLAILPARTRAEEPAPLTSRPASRDSTCTQDEAGRTTCVDDAVRDELNARRQYRGVQERIFQKARRHELSGYAGGYAADLTSASYLVGGAYTYHLSEDLGLEASFGYTRSRAELIRIVENRTGTDLIRPDSPVFVYGGHLLWTLAYGKLRWFHNRIGRFDLYLALGGGITDNRSARSLMFSGGLGLKFYATSWLGVRFDVRDQISNQELLGESRIVNNVVCTLGLSMFLPFHP